MSPERMSGRSVRLDVGLESHSHGIDPGDARVVRALEEYAETLQHGRRPDRGRFLARHADVAVVLTDCLEGLDFLRFAGDRLVVEAP